MNRIKLQEKFFRLIGGLEIDKSHLMDIFISRIFKLLKPGQKIKINDLGYFHKIRFKISSDRISKDYKNLSHIIVFSESENIDEYFGEDEVFWEPTKFDLDFNSNENLFSLSIGKEFFSSDLIQSSQIIIPFTRNEYLDLLESKVEKLISNSVILENSQTEIPCLNITIQKEEKDFFVEKIEDIVDQNQKELTPAIEDSITEELNKLQDLDFSEILSDKFSDSSFSDEVIIEETIKSTEENGITLADNSKNFDLSTDISDESKEESIFNDLLTLEEIDQQKNETNSFIEGIDNYEISETDMRQDKLSSNIDSEENEEFNVYEEISWDKIISEIGSEEEEISIETFFQTENKENELLDSVVDEDNNVKDNLDENTIIASDEIKEDLAYDQFDNVIQEIETDEENEQISLLEELTNEKVDEEIQENIQIEENISDDETFESNTEDEIIDEKELEDAEEEYISQDISKKILTEKIPEEEIPRKSNKVWILAIFLVIALSSAIVYYVFPNYFNLFQSDQQELSLNISDKNTIKIERNFEIPVTYPYPPIDEQRLKNSIESNLKIETNLPEKSSDINTKEIDKKNNKQESVIPEKVNTQNNIVEKVSDTITKSGDIYIVQVASFRSESIAQKEVNKIKSKGYSAFQERKEIPNRGTWYRVKVSGFKSADEAQNFQLKYSKGDI